MKKIPSKEASCKQIPADISRSYTADERHAELLASHQAVPKQLKLGRRWVAFGSESKKPLVPGLRSAYTMDPVGASHGRAWDWRPFDEALDALLYESHGDYSYLGMAMGRAPGSRHYVGSVDLDHVVDADGRVPDWVQKIIDRFATYVELSKSGSGLHLYFTLDPSRLPESFDEAAGKRQLVDGDRPIEVYTRRRFMIWTGRTFGPPVPVIDATDALLELIAASRPARSKKKKPGRRTSASGAPPVKVGDGDRTRAAEVVEAIFDQPEYRRIWKALGVNLPAAGETLVRCPFHDDHNPSLSINPARGHHCHAAGCAASGGLQALIKALASLSGSGRRLLALRSGRSPEEIARLCDSVRCKSSISKLAQPGGSPSKMELLYHDYLSCLRRRDLAPSLEDDLLERAAMMEVDGRLTRAEAERQALESVGSLAEVQCGIYLVLEWPSGDGFSYVWQTCGRLDCHHCGALRRAQEHEAVLAGLQALDVTPSKLYVYRIDEDQWKSLKRRLDRRAAVVKWVRTIGGRLVLATVSVSGFEATVYDWSEREAAVRLLMTNIRPRLESDKGRHMLGGSRCLAIVNTQDEDDKRDKGVLVGTCRRRPADVAQLATRLGCYATVENDVPYLSTRASPGCAVGWGHDTWPDEVYRAIGVRYAPSYLRRKFEGIEGVA